MGRYTVPETTTLKQIQDFGFTNYNEPVLYYNRMLDKLVSINVSIMKKSRRVKVEYLFEEIMQPADISRNKELMDKSDSIISTMIKSGILEEKQ